GRDKVRALRKVAIEGADADAGPGRDLPHRGVHARRREHRHRRLQQRVQVPPGVGAQGAGRRFAQTESPLAKTEQRSVYIWNAVPFLNAFAGGGNDPPSEGAKPCRTSPSPWKAFRNG